jgi:hypothetical protein
VIREWRFRAAPPNPQTLEIVAATMAGRSLPSTPTKARPMELTDSKRLAQGTAGARLARYPVLGLNFARTWDPTRLRFRNLGMISGRTMH